jgi:hypothetical protein
MKLKHFVAISALTLALGLTGCGGGSSAQVQPPPPPPPPAFSISSISPSSAAPGGPDLTLIVVGSSFDGKGVIRSRVLWSTNGTTSPLSTTFISSNQLTAVIPTALLSNPVTAQVSVQNWDPIEGVSDGNTNSVSFTVKFPGGVSISSISPTSAVAGSSDLPLTVAGNGFVGTTHNKRWPVWSVNGTNTILATTSLSNTQLTAVVPAALLSSALTAQVFIQYGDPMGDGPLSKSNSVNFNVTASVPNSVSVSPSSDTLGPRGVRQFAFTIDGGRADATWVVEEGAVGGTITSSGLYTAPSEPGTYHVAATAVMDSSKNATASVSVGSSGFTLTGSMGTARSGHVATLLANGKVLILGGDASAELFDPASRTFTPTGSMTISRFRPTATSLANGTVLIAGGFGSGTSQLPRLSSAELYDPGSGTFTATGSMAVGRVLHTATLLDDGRVLIAGGTDASGGGGAATASSELYDPSAGTFTLTGSMESERADHSGTLLASGEVLIVGGWNGHAADAADDPPWDPLFAELFDPSSGSFTASGSMSTTRIGDSAIRLASGKVLVLGGVPSLQNVHQQLPDPHYAELYDPAAGTLSSAGNFTLSRTNYTATLLNDGMVLIAGGEQAGIKMTSSELLDPTTGTLSATGGLTIARTGHTATRLNDGRVLATGGTDSSGNALASAELYQ